MYNKIEYYMECDDEKRKYFLHLKLKHLSVYDDSILKIARNELHGKLIENNVKHWYHTIITNSVKKYSAVDPVDYMTLYYESKTKIKFYCEKNLIAARLLT